MIAPSTVALPAFSIWWPPALAAIGGLAVGILVRVTVLRWAAKAAAKTAWRFDDVLIATISGPIVLWFVLLGLRLSVRLLPLTSTADSVLGTIILVLGILTVTWALARFASRMLALGVGRHLPSASLLTSLVQIIVFMIGLLVIFDTLGIQIKGILAALGVGGLAVGLALQDTLANFFAGLRIIAARKIRSGDMVKLETGQEGFVEDINWGQTTIREGVGNLIIVPNVKLASAIVVNYALPTPPAIVVLNMGVSYDADLPTVEKVTLEEALDTQHTVPEAISSFVPALRFSGFGDSAINFFVVLQARSYQERFNVVSDFVKRIHARYGREGIEIPFPHRVVLMDRPEGASTPGSPASP